MRVAASSSSIHYPFIITSNCFILVRVSRLPPQTPLPQGSPNIATEDYTSQSAFSPHLHLFPALLCYKTLHLSMDVRGKSSDPVAATQGQLLREHHQWIGEVECCVMQLTNAIPPSRHSQAAASRSHWSSIAHPDKYNRNPALCKGFLLQSSLFLTSLRPMMDEEKVVEFINLLTDKALVWATAVWKARDEALCSFGRFQKLFHRVFEHATGEGEASKWLLDISQGHDMTLEFSTLAAGSGWNEPALKVVFCCGHNVEVLAEIACRDEKLPTDSFIYLAIRLDNLLRKHAALSTQAALPNLARGIGGGVTNYATTAASLTTSSTSAWPGGKYHTNQLEDKGGADATPPHSESSYPCYLLLALG